MGVHYDTAGNYGFLCDEARGGCPFCNPRQPATITITISRKAAEKVADWPDDERYPFSAELGKAARAALEGER